MIISIHDILPLAESHPELYGRILQTAHFDTSRTLLELPDNFEWQGLAIQPAASRPLLGFGDLVAAIAKPIAGAIDSVAGTDLTHCGGCQQRQEWLNEKLPFK